MIEAISYIVMDNAQKSIIDDDTASLTEREIKMLKKLTDDVENRKMVWEPRQRKGGAKKNSRVIPIT